MLNEQTLQSMLLTCIQRHHSLWWPEQTQRDPNLTPFNNLTLWASRKILFHPSTVHHSGIVITVCNWPRIPPHTRTCCDQCRLDLAHFHMAFSQNPKSFRKIRQSSLGYGGGIQLSRCTYACTQELAPWSKARP